ncbi:MAG: hypothetical protein ACOZB0_06750 [Pseudomonadota bacterium]
MTPADDAQDLFGKIDAMFGKRAGFTPGLTRAEDDFPVLTEVVEAVAPSAPEPMTSGRDALVEPPEASPDLTVGQLTEVDIDRLAVALEARLAELFIRQQLRVEALVRRVVREELDARRD